ncbi:MAG: signal peptidase I [Candidatus Gracilibacteria bacterium]
MVFAPLLLYAIVKTLFFSPFLVEGNSMLPSLQNGELFLVDRMSYREISPRRGDIVIFSLPEDSGYYYVKRVIGVPGDRIHLEKDGVYLTDVRSGVRSKLDEPYVMPVEHPNEKFLSDANELGQDFIVPQGKYFVMGDNREHSKDSRSFTEPFIPRDQIVGKFGFQLELPFLSTDLAGDNHLALNSSQEAYDHLQRSEPQDLPQKLLFVEKPDGQKISLRVQVARDSMERTVGLMHRFSMPQDEGMIFLFEDEKPLVFWMKNTFIPLDIIYASADWRVVSIQKNAQPCNVEPCPLYPSTQKAQYVLEINGGLSDKLEIQEGTKLQLP